jgi:rubrerythrin
MNEPDLLDLLHEGRARERGQTLFYRRLTGLAEDSGNAVAAERLNALLADEQHHLSRLSARLLELGGRLDEGDRASVPESDLQGWEDLARRREVGEVSWYETAIATCSDTETEAILREILASELHHRDELGGKWMPASSRPSGPGEGA